MDTTDPIMDKEIGPQMGMVQGTLLETGIGIDQIDMAIEIGLGIGIEIGITLGVIVETVIGTEVTVVVSPVERERERESSSVLIEI